MGDKVKTYVLNKILSLTGNRELKFGNSLFSDFSKIVSGTYENNDSRKVVSAMKDFIAPFNSMPEAGATVSWTNLKGITYRNMMYEALDMKDPQKIMSFAEDISNVILALQKNERLDEAKRLKISSDMEKITGYLKNLPR